MPSQPPTVLVATNSPGKLQEFQWVLSGAPVELVTLRDLGLELRFDETGSTAADNAVQKAVLAAERSNLPSLADDSSLAIPALGGAPGVAVRRWQGQLPDDVADEEWLEFFVAQVAHLPEDQRGASFTTAVALATPAGPAGGAATVDVVECESDFVIKLPPRPPLVPGMPINSVRFIPEHQAFYNDLPLETRLAVHRGRLVAGLTGVLERRLGAG